MQVTIAGQLPSSLQYCSRAASPDKISGVPFSRWDLDSLWRGKQQTRARFGGFLPEVAAFDCAAFGVSVPEAELMDPQQRLLLEVCELFFLADMLQFCPGKNVFVAKVSMRNWLALANSWLGYVKLVFAFDLIQPSYYPQKCLLWSL